MRFIIINILIILIVLTTFSACKEDEGLPREKIAQIFVDILIAEQTYQNDLDSLNIAVQSVYDKHGISKSIYDNEISKFASDEESWKEFFDSAKTYLDSLKTEGSNPDF
jgi:hypothetical protein